MILRVLGYVLVAAAYAFVVAPIAIVVVMSFSSDNYIVFPPSGWTLRWYGELWSRAEFHAAVLTSLQIATAVTALTLTLGVPAALAIVRGTGRWRDSLYAFLTSPQLVPSVVLGLMLLLVFAPRFLVATLTGIIIAHIVITLPFVVRVMVTTFSTIAQDCEDAAATLGAPPFVVFWRVTLPLAAPGLLASAAIAFIVSFDETVVTLFLSGPRFSTLPIEVFRYVTNRTDPLVAALSTVLLLVTATLITAVERSIGLVNATSDKRG
jgi:putative spermidine/putrescine transport system permease protein